MFIGLTGGNNTKRHIVATIIQFLMFEDLIKKNGTELVSTEGFALHIFRRWPHNERRKHSGWEMSSLNELIMYEPAVEGSPTWTKKIDALHYITGHTTTCGKALLGNNYIKDYVELDRNEYKRPIRTVCLACITKLFYPNWIITDIEDEAGAEYISSRKGRLYKITDVNVTQTDTFYVNNYVVNLGNTADLMEAVRKVLLDDQLIS